MISTDALLAGLRILIGLLVAAHGAQKLFGWFGGPGLNGFAGWLGSMGFPQPKLWATLAALGEFGGGMLVALGLFTPVGAAMIIAAMIVAIAKVHWDKGLWVANGGYEFNLVLIANALFIGMVGPGAYALDNAIDLPWSNGTLFTISLIGALIGVLIALAVSSTHQPLTTDPQDTSERIR